LLALRLRPGIFRTKAEGRRVASPIETAKLENQERAITPKTTTITVG